MRNLADMFEADGVHVVCDGQYGSTGKGALSAFLADTAAGLGITEWAGAISNAGPNSGHTFYYNGEKHVLKQLPTFAVYMGLLGYDVPVYLSAGSVIDPNVLIKELHKYPFVKVFVHELAAVIYEENKAAEKEGSIAAVASTRSGTGSSLSMKVQREPGIVFRSFYNSVAKSPMTIPDNLWVMPADGWNDTMRRQETERFFMEISQGFSLGLNQRFYPKCTSRECTVSQGLADAGLPPRSVTKTFMAVRTYPIRVGNVDGFDSGSCYPDQEETSWEDLGVEPELTTVTRRVRRVFTWSDQQFLDALSANAPDYVFVNFMNYLNSDYQGKFVHVITAAGKNHGFEPLFGYGPKVEDIQW